MIEYKEYQRYYIKKKNNFNFEQSLKEIYKEKDKFNIKFRNQINSYVNLLHDSGVLFYGIKINFTDFNLKDNMWNYAHHRVEELIYLISTDIELAEFCYLALEKDFNGIPQINGIIAIRSLVGPNPNLLAQLKKYFFEFYHYMEIKDLSSIQQINTYWNYVIKENNWKFHRMMCFSEHFVIENNTLFEFELNLMFSNKDCNDSSWFFGGYLDESKTKDIKGLNTKDSAIILLYLLNLYFSKEEIYLFENKFYKKMNDVEYSYIDCLDYLRINNLTILQQLQLRYPQQLQNLNVAELLINNFDELYQKIKINNHYLPNLQFFEFKVMFCDGIFKVFAKNDRV